ncbi:MAG: sigma-70 family RNA polymerase sigma factor [Bacteroidales bacterium]|nr:sigma-70 family RNA polymerase sigma factor [Bacteroidales bacterium]
MNPISEAKLIDGVIKKRRAAIHFMYKDYFPLILALVQKNSGTRQDAEDLFQDGLVALYLRCRDKELVLHCSLRSYFYSICRNLWLQRLERKCRFILQPDLLVNECEETYHSKTDLIQEKKLERYRLFWRHFKQLPDDCQKVFQMYFDKIPFKTIAKNLGMQDADYVKVRKYLCKKLLIKRIKKDPEYLNCINHE